MLTVRDTTYHICRCCRPHILFLVLEASLVLVVCLKGKDVCERPQDSFKVSTKNLIWQRGVTNFGRSDDQLGQELSGVDGHSVSPRLFSSQNCVRRVELQANLETNVEGDVLV
jgi:hypothetical protein